MMKPSVLSDQHEGTRDGTIESRVPLLQNPQFEDSCCAHTFQLPPEVSKMNAIVIERDTGSFELLQLRVPHVGDDDVLIQVERAAVNRSDIRKRMKGSYFTRAGFCLPGVECSGQIIATGKNVKHWNLNDTVCAVLDGGGYAQYVAVSSELVLPIPRNITMEEAACLPEAAINGWHALTVGNLKRNTRLLIDANCGDLGIFALQMAKYKGAEVYVTSGSTAKLDFYKDLGADVCLNYREQDFLTGVDSASADAGVDLILDSSPDNLKRNVDALGYRGTVIVVESHDSMYADLDISTLLHRHGEIRALKRPSGNKRKNLIEEVKKEVWPAVEDGYVKPIVHQTFPLAEAEEAHRVLDVKEEYGCLGFLCCFVSIARCFGAWLSEDNSPNGKILLDVQD